MVNANAILSHLSLVFTLLARWLGAWGAGPGPARFVATVERTEAALANAIRASLTQDALAFPDLDDPAFLVWFKTAYTAARAGVERPVRARRTTLPLVEFPMLCCASHTLDRRLPAGKAEAGWKPAVHRARAPPWSGSACKPNHRPAPSGRPLALALCRRGNAPPRSKRRAPGRDKPASKAVHATITKRRRAYRPPAQTPLSRQ